MKRAIVAAISCMVVSTVCSADFSGNISGTLGKKSLDDNDWDGVESQNSFGVISDFKMKSWPVSIAADGFVSVGDDKSLDNSDADTDLPEVDATTVDLHLGLRKIWDIEGSNFSPYIGGGVAFINGSRERLVDDKREDENDAATGAWFGVGMYWRPTKHLNIGVDARYSRADITLYDKDISAGGFRAGLLVGYHF